MSIAEQPRKPLYALTVMARHDDLIEGIVETQYKDPAPFIIELLRKFDDERTNKTVADYLSKLTYTE